MKKSALVFIFFLCSLGTILAQRTISGTVFDDNGEALIGANVIVKGEEGVGTTTNIDGAFSLEVPAGANTLVFSYTGYTTQEQVLGASNVMNIILTEGILVGEVVVTGYSELSRNRSVASVSTVGNEALENIPMTDVNQLIQGRSPGVFTTANSGQPGAQQQIRIRGTGSITAGRNPLYVLDGVIIEQGNTARLDAGSNATDILSLINPNDIERVDILKDAAATALYGSRGSNGVVVITTKKGKEGKTNITAKVQYGTTQPNTGNFEMMSAQQAWDYERKVLANTGADQAQIDAARPSSMLDATTDWVDAAFRTGVTNNYELQASGGTAKTKFFLSGGYFAQEGTLIESDFDRYSARANVSNQATDKLSFGLNFNIAYSTQKNAVNGNRFASPLLAAFVNTPLQSAFKDDGTLYTGLEADFMPFLGDNFLYSTPINYVDVNQFRLLSRVNMDYNILDNLKFSQVVNVDLINVDEVVFQDLSTNDGEPDGSITNSFVHDRTTTTKSLLRYFDTFGTDHNFSVTAGYEYQRFRERAFSANGTGFASGKLQTLNSAAEPAGVSGDKTTYSFISFLGIANYDYQGKYLFNASFRRDGSSRFPTDNPYANFWSVGAGWNIDQESFLDGVDFISALRLKASYGTSGNAAIGNFAWRGLYGFGTAYQNSPGSAPSQIANPDLTWENAQNFNIGLDFGLLESGRIGGTIEYYNRTTTDLLLNVPVSATSGFTTALRNIGKMENSGVEITITGNPVQSASTDGFNWTTSFNISFNKNQILELPGGEDIDNGTQIYREGEPIRSIYMQQWAGVNPADGTPLWNTADENENVTGTTGTYNQAGQFLVGNAEPDFIAGWNNTFSFKGVSLSAFFYTAQGHELYNSSRRFIESDGQRYGWNHLAVAADHWENPGDNAERPQPLQGGNNGANSNSTRFLEDASFIRLRNVSLGYSLPSSVLEKAKLGAVNVYIQGQNLWTITDYSGFDPEADEDGSEFFRYPVGKSITFGLDLTF